MIKNHREGIVVALEREDEQGSFTGMTHNSKAGGPVKMAFYRCRD